METIYRFVIDCFQDSDNSYTLNVYADSYSDASRRVGLHAFYNASGSYSIIYKGSYNG